MTKTFTENDLIRYVYGETTEKENEMIEKAMLCDEALQENFQKLQQTIAQLDNCLLKPSQESIDKVLNYAKSSKLPSVMK